MLLANDIHFLVESEVNAQLGRSIEPQELDEIMNSVVFRLVNEATAKELKARQPNERLLLQELTKEYCGLVNNGKAELPADYSLWLKVNSTIYRTDCGKTKVVLFKNGDVLQAVSNVKYNGKWYKPGEVFQGLGDSVGYYGEVVRLPSKQQLSIFVEAELFNSYSTTSLTSTLYTIVGNEILFKSKYSVTGYCMSYIATLGDEFKIDSCKDHTLKFNETIQRWVVDRTILRIAAGKEESQQKIENFTKL